MLSPNQMVMIRRAKERLYIGVFDVVEQVEYIKPNGSVGFRAETTIKGQPCKLSFESSQSAVEGDKASSAEQVIRLIFAPEVVLKIGSRIIVTQNNTTGEYRASGERAVFMTHQEVILKRHEPV